MKEIIKILNDYGYEVVLIRQRIYKLRRFL